MASSIEIPEYIDKYKVIKILGQGGMGTVYQCLDPTLQRLVAVKVLNPQKSKTLLETNRMRFLREALATAQLQHPGIPPVYDVRKEKNGQVYYVMKTIEGKQLRNILNDLRLGDSEVTEKYDLFRLIEILRDVCQAIEYAHSKGYIHRDLKPSNIFVGDYGEVYVIDWGLTKIIKGAQGQESEESKQRVPGEDSDSSSFSSSEGSSEFSDQFLKSLAETIPDNDFTELANLTRTVFMDEKLPVQNREYADEVMEKLKQQLEENKKNIGKKKSGNRKKGKEKAIEELEDIMEEDISVLTSTLLFDDLSDKREKRTPEMSRTLTLQGKILGTLSYMPPEQALGKIDALGQETDVYALGVILYEILTLDLPIDSNDFKEFIDLKLNGTIELPEIRAADRKIPHELSAIAMQALNPDVTKRFHSVKDFNGALNVWLEGKSQYRVATKPSIETKDFKFLPGTLKNAWSIDNNSITTNSFSSAKNSYLLFEREFIGDVRFSFNVIAYPQKDEGDEISEFAVVLRAAVPKPWKGFVDGYTVHFGASKNTRAFITKNDVEVVSNEYLMIEPRSRYQLVIECEGNNIRVILHGQVILFYHDSNLCQGLRFGFFHKGNNIVYSNINIETRGLPNKIAAIDVPEALMVEECYESALKRFLSIAQGHQYRYEGAWARYRAGMASYLNDRNRRKALRIWAPLKDGPYAIFEKLGRASLELENNRPLKAAKIINAMLSGNNQVPHLDPVGEIVFSQAQQRLRQKPKTERDWQVIDAWARLALALGQRLENKESMTPSILWRWIFLVLTQYPHHMSDSIHFLRKTFGKGKGMFAEILTTIDPLMTILKRSAEMSDNVFLVDKVMRLILSHDSNLGNLETLVRFYLHSGHIDVARRISLHIYSLCEKHECEIPAGPIAFLACLSWVRNEEDAKDLVKVMNQKSTLWAKADGMLLLGLEYYRAGDVEKARNCWQKTVEDPNAMFYNRHLVGKGLLGELAVDPVEAGVPNRSDHRLLYCLFLGYKHFADWQKTGSDSDRETAIVLLKKALKLARPSYDIYSATDLFARIPMEIMEHEVEEAPQPPALTEEEELWLYKLTVAASQGKPNEIRRPFTTRRRGSKRGSSRLKYRSD